MKISIPVDFEADIKDVIEKFNSTRGTNFKLEKFHQDTEIGFADISFDDDIDKVFLLGEYYGVYMQHKLNK